MQASSTERNTRDIAGGGRKIKLIIYVVRVVVRSLNGGYQSQSCCFSSSARCSAVVVAPRDVAKISNDNYRR